MRVLFTGLNGLTGSSLARHILNSDRKIYAGSIYRSLPSVPLSIPASLLASEFYYASLDDITELTSILDSFRPTHVVHLAQLRLVPIVLKALERSSARILNLLVLGTTGVFSNFQACKEDYCLAEDLLRRSDIPYTVLRSTMIYGSPHDKNIHKLVYAINSGIPILLPSGGRSKFMPVYYSDLASVLFHLLFSVNPPRGFFNITGPDIVSLSEIVSIISRYLRAAPLVLDVPCSFLHAPLILLESILPAKLSLPVSSEQILRLTEDKVYSSHVDQLLPASFHMTSIRAGLFSLVCQVCRSCL